MKQFLTFLIGIVIGAFAVYFYCCNADAITSPSEYVAPKGAITPEKAMALDKQFNKRHQLISDSILKKPDNRSAWFTLEDLRGYLDFAENEAKGLGYRMNGVRVYLGAYPNNGYTTVFFIPTGHKIKSQGSMGMVTYGDDNGDIEESTGLNAGQNGYPPQANYPQ